MILLRLCLALFSALLLLQGTATAQTSKTWAYFAWWLPDSWRSAPIDRLDRLLFFELKVHATGSITVRNGWPEKWTDLRSALKQRGIPLDLTLTLFDPQAFDALFSSPDAAQRLLDEAVALASHDDVAGLQLDFEVYTAIRPAVLASYRNFVRELSRRLRQQSPARNLSVFFPMGGEAVLYDAPTLALVDQVVMQGYDAHWAESKTAGPVAPLRGSEAVTWEKAVATGLALGVKKEQLLLSFPLYGYEWQVKDGALRSATIGKGETTSFAPISPGLVPAITVNIRERVLRYGASHDALAGSAHYRFRKPNGQYYEGWFEDWWSLRRKGDYLKQEQLGGIAFFVLGYDNNELVEYYLRERLHRSR